MEEKKQRRGRDDSDAEFEKRVSRQLYEAIEKDPTSNIVRSQARLIELLRENAPQQTNPTLDLAEKRLFQLIKDRGLKYDIKRQSDIVQRLNAAPPPSKSTLQNHHRSRTIRSTDRDLRA